MSATADETKTLISGILGEIDARWSETFQASGKTYTAPKLVLFRNHDIKARLDRCSGSTCQFAVAYIIARQVGHHIQNLLGILPKVTHLQQAASSKAESDALQVWVELQADCLSGAWVNLEEKKRPGFVAAGDIDAILKTASALGDDTQQRESQGRTIPDSFTHGTGEKRKHWFLTGYEQGTLQACNTFSDEKQ